MRRVRIIVHGKVQGVFFRYSVKQIADKLKVKGYARNNFDKTIEIVAEGSEEAISTIIQFCRRGPPMARVDRADMKEEKFIGEHDKFEII